MLYCSDFMDFWNRVDASVSLGIGWMLLGGFFKGQFSDYYL